LFSQRYALHIFISSFFNTQKLNTGIHSPHIITTTNKTNELIIYILIKYHVAKHISTHDRILLFIPTVHIKQSNLFYISTVVNADDYKQIVQ